MPPHAPTHRLRDLFVSLAVLAACSAPSTLMAQPVAGSPTVPPVITTARAAHDLPLNIARRNIPVHLRAVVTYFDEHLNQHHLAMFVHDSSGGVFVAIPLGTTWPGHLPAPGSLIDITGVTAVGDYAPMVDRAHVTLVGTAPLPTDPAQVSLSDLRTGAYDGQWVQIDGVVHSVFQTATNITLQISTGEGLIGATTLKRPGFDYSTLVDSWIKVRGSVGPLFNAKHQITGCKLFFPGVESVWSLTPQPADPFIRPIQAIDSLLRYNPVQPWPHRVHIRGAVTLYWPSRSICIQDSTGGLCAETLQTTSTALGSNIDLVGFITPGGFAPGMSDASFRPSGGATSTSPRRVNPLEAALGSYDSSLVSIEGRLIDLDLASDDPQLTLSAGKNTFRVLLPHGVATTSIEKIPVGSLLRITGICSDQIDAHNLLQTLGPTRASGFSILLRSADDVVVLRTPSWWTSGRVDVVLQATLLVAIGGFVWVIVLRRRVARSTRELLESRELYRHMAHHDSLTGLPTRALLQDRLQNAIERARRSNKSIAVLMLDLDNFKQVNDSFGHDVGDVVLRVTAERIQETIRRVDSVARMGGDEFIVVLNDLTNPMQAQKIAAKIVAALSEPVPVGEIKIPISASVGVCSLSEDEPLDSETILKRVDAAMYRAKDQGRRCFQVYSSDMLGPGRDRIQFRTALAHALERNELELVYQPLIDCPTGELTGFEALLRWQSPELGLVMPREFIPLAEESGLIVPIGKWVLEQACRSVGQIELELGRRFQLSVNLSPIQFDRCNLPEIVEDILTQAGRDPRLLSLEITETNLVQDTSDTLQALDRLREFGVQLVLDDFGVGFSTLSYITRFPVDWVKIDRSLIRYCTTSRRSLTVIRAIVEMAHALEIRVLGEGVETLEQFTLLRDEGCDAVQGFYISHPVAPSLLAALSTNLTDRAAGLAPEPFPQDEHPVAL